MVYDLFREYYMGLKYVLECFQVQVRFGELWWFWSFLRCSTAQTRHMFSYEWRHSHGVIKLALQYHRFEVNQHHVAEVVHVLLKSDQFASREEAVEEMKECRSTTQPWCQSMVMLEFRPSLFHDRLKPRSYLKLPYYPWTTQNPIYVFLSH